MPMHMTYVWRMTKYDTTYWLNEETEMIYAGLYWLLQG